MKTKTKINGVEVVKDDGNPDTSDIEILDGELSEEADEEMDRWHIKILERRGYKVTKI